MPAESPLVHQATTPPVWRGSALMQVLTQALIDAGLSTDVSSMDEATSPAPRGSPAGGQAPSMAPPPVRLHCQWQTGVLTVWIGHDQGQEAAVGLLVHSLQKWCVIERQSLPKVVVNGSRWERHFDADAPAADRDQVFHFYPSPPRPYLETC